MQKVFLILFVGVCGVFVERQMQGASTDMNDILLENVEALANAEIIPPTYCYGDGNYICPSNGKKCGFVYQGYSLTPDEEAY